MSFNSTDVITVIAAFAFSLALTPLVRMLARRWGAVASPKADRWHKKPTAMLGGIAIFGSVVGTSLLFVPLSTNSWVVIGSSSFLFAL